jgi:hypothetical protein
VLRHGVSAGSDSGTVGIQMLYWDSTASTLFLTTYPTLSDNFTKSRDEKTPLPGQDIVKKLVFLLNWIK